MDNTHLNLCIRMIVDALDNGKIEWQPVPCMENATWLRHYFVDGSLYLFRIETDEWNGLPRVCYAFGVAADPFVAFQNTLPIVDSKWRLPEWGSWNK